MSFLVRVSCLFACLFACAVGGVGCASLGDHVALSAPSSSAPLAERQQAYEQLRPLGVAGVPDPTNQLGLLSGGRFPFLQLSDGRRVVACDDLVAVVDADSLTAEAAKKSGDLRVLTNALWTGGVLGIAVGAGVAIAGPGVASAGAAAGDFNVVSGGLLLSVVGLGTVTAGTIASVVASEFAATAEAEKMSAFLLYDRDLRRHLQLDAPPTTTTTTTPLPPSPVDPPPVVVPPTTSAPTAPVDPSGG